VGPIGRGKKFNKTCRKFYDYNEIVLANGKVLDSYVKGEAGEEGAIVSRKATDIDLIEEDTFRRYLKEEKDKYAPGTKINSKKYTTDEIGETLEGQQYLEIPSKNKKATNRREFERIAWDEFKIKIRYRDEEE
jgi:hypothetical protein